MKAARILTVSQPWASLLVDGGKDVENRTWRTNYRGPVLIQAGVRHDAFWRDAPSGSHAAAVLAGRFVARNPIAHEDVRGAIIGIVTILRCEEGSVYGSRSPWRHPGAWHWVVDPKLSRAFPEPILWKGGLGLRHAPRELLDLIPE